MSSTYLADVSAAQVQRGSWSTGDSIRTKAANSTRSIKYNSAAKYIQHNPLIADGLDGLQKGVAGAVDLFRLENGKIVEHWDVIEPIPPASEWKNTNGNVLATGFIRPRKIHGFKEGVMVVTILLWGAAAGVVHFVVVGILYGNPLVGHISAKAESESPAVKHWATKGKYFVTQFLGTQIEVYILTIAFVWLRPLVGFGTYGGAILLGCLFAAIRVYPRFWNMWIQTTYPTRLLIVEIVNGTIGTLVISVFLQAVTQR